MRTSLRDTQMLDNYTFSQQTEEESLLTEARLLLSPELQDKLHWQQQVYELVQLYGRRRLKEELEAVHEQLFTESCFGKFRSQIYRIFKKA